MRNTLLKLNNTMVSLSQGGLIQLQVVAAWHLALLLDVLTLQLLKVWTYLTKVVDDGEHLRLCRIKLVLEFTNSFGSFLLGLALGVGMQFARCIFSISNANESRLIDLGNGILFVLLFGFAVGFLV